MSDDDKYKRQRTYTERLKALGFKRKTVVVHDDDWSEVRLTANSLKAKRMAKTTRLNTALVPVLDNQEA